MGAGCFKGSGKGSQLPPEYLYTTVRVVFDPYDHPTVQEYLRRVSSDFGYRNRDRWYYVTSREPATQDAWALDFKFRDPHDAVLFGLKYLR